MDHRQATRLVLVLVCIVVGIAFTAFRQDKKDEKNTTPGHRSTPRQINQPCACPPGLPDIYTVKSNVVILFRGLVQQIELRP